MDDKIKKRAKKVVDAGMNIPLANLTETIETNEKLEELLTKGIGIPDEIEISLEGVEYIKGEKGDTSEYPQEVAISNLPEVQKVELLNFDPSSLFKGISQIKGEKGDKGDTYTLTEKDKLDISKTIKAPVVEKIVEHIIHEQPIVTNEIKEVAITETAEEILNKINTIKEGIEQESVKGLKEIKDLIESLSNRRIIAGGSGGVKEVVAGTNITVDNSNLGYPVVSSTGGGSYGLDADKPAASSSNINAIYFSTDINGGTPYMSNGVSWVKMSAGVNAETGIPSTTWAARGSASTLGAGYIQRITDIGNNVNVMIQSDGTNWCPFGGRQRLYTTTTPIAGNAPGTTSDTVIIPSWTVPGGLLASTFALDIILNAHATATPIAATPSLTLGGTDVFSAMGTMRRLLLAREIRNKTTTTQHIIQKNTEAGGRLIVDNDGQDKTKNTTGNLVLAGSVNYTHASAITGTIDSYYVDWIL